MVNMSEQASGAAYVHSKGDVSLPTNSHALDPHPRFPVAYKHRTHTHMEESTLPAACVEDNEQQREQVMMESALPPTVPPSAQFLMPLPVTQQATTADSTRSKNRGAACMSCRKLNVQCTGCLPLVSSSKADGDVWQEKVEEGMKREVGMALNKHARLQVVSFFNHSLFHSLLLSFHSKRCFRLSLACRPQVPAPYKEDENRGENGPHDNTEAHGHNTGGGGISKNKRKRGGDQRKKQDVEAALATAVRAEADRSILLSSSLTGWTPSRLRPSSWTT